MHFISFDEFAKLTTYRRVDDYEDVDRALIFGRFATSDGLLIQFMSANLAIKKFLEGMKIISHEVIEKD